MVQQDNRTCEPRRRNLYDPDIRVSYLLVSPILPPLAWLFGGVRVVGMSTTSTAGMVTRQDGQVQKYCTSVKSQRPTLAIIGERDGFTSVKKVRKWARDTNGAQVAEVPEAGHFWKEEGAVEQLKERVERWTAL